MFGRKLIYLLFTAALWSVTVSAKQNDLKIVVEPGTDAKFKVSISFEGDASGTTNVRLPNEWGGQRELFKAIRILSVLPASATTLDTAEPFLKTISHRPGEKITIVYELTQDFQGQLKNSVRYRPVSTREFIHWIGNTVWVLPEWKDESEVAVELEWKRLDRSWTIANSFGVSKRSQRFKTQFSDLRSSIFVAGNFRITSTKASGKPVNVAIRGSWNFTDAELAEMVRKVIETERDFFNDNSQDYFLVTLVPVDEGPNTFSFGGTGLTDSFALFATPNANIDGLRGLLAHEYFHNWNPARLGKMPEPEQSLYWFSEGFTEFYTYQLLYRGGLITQEEFVGRYNELIREYYMLPVRNEPNERIIKDFWNDRGVSRLPYLRGLLFATNLNAAIKRETAGKQSLDDVMLDLFAASRRAPKPITFESLTQRFNKYFKSDAASLIKRTIIDGETIEPVADALGNGFTREVVKVPVFELGFDFEKFAKERVVSGVHPNSAAYEAGLRDGQQRNGGLSLTFGDTTKEIELKVREHGIEKMIRYLPVAKERVSIPQFRIAAK